MALSFSEAKKIPITEYLSRAGFEPARIRGNDYWYRSPFRSDNNPSFKVNVKLNVWYDHGTGEGGTLLDLGMKMHNCSLHEFVASLEGDYQGRIFEPTRYSAPEAKLEIVSVRSLIDLDLLRYLDERGIRSTTAREFCKEVKFSISHREYLAVGFPNRSGGYELRNRWFKGSSSPKDISIIKNGADKVCVMEGFVDFLSIPRLKEIIPEISDSVTDFLILNSLSLLKKNLGVFNNYNSVTAFFDNDQAGEVAKSVLTDSNIKFSDASYAYQGYNDVNDFTKAILQQENDLTRSRGLRR